MTIYSNDNVDIIANRLRNQREIRETAMLGPYIRYWTSNNSYIILRNECYDIMKQFFNN